MKLLVKNGYLIDPASNREGQFDILVEDGMVAKVGKGLRENDKKIDASGCIVAPGFIDLHTHLREPGHEYKETVATGTAAAAAGGFTSVLCMANTEPANDNASVTNYILDKATEEGKANVFPVGAVTKGLKGESLAEIGELANAGCVAVSDDGHYVANSLLMRKAMEYAKGFGLFIISHAEDPELAKGVAHEGQVATEAGLPGIPREAEEVAIFRDIELAALTGCRLHIAHISTARSVDLVRQAKRRGIPVTCEVTPHHFTLSSDAIASYDTNAKMRPPLRTREDIRAIHKGLADGTIDAIATDHAPHSPTEKEVEFIEAANGIVGLETALPLTLALVERKLIPLRRMIELLSSTPAKIAGLTKGALKEGSDADIVIFDPKASITVNAGAFKSKGRNTPFHGWRLKGQVKFTIAAGKIAHQK